MSRSTLEKAYWKATLGLLARMLLIWVVIFYGVGNLLGDQLGRWQVGGYPFGSWLTQQGSVVLLLLLMVYYARKMGELKRKFEVQDD